MNAASVDIGRRIRAVRRKLNRLKADALVLTRPANVTYLTGFSGSDSWAVIGKGGAHLLTDGRYTEQACAECRRCRIVERSSTLAEAVGTLARRLRWKRLAVEKSASLADFEAIRKAAGCCCQAAADLVEALRSVKDTGEVAPIKKAARIAARVFSRVRQMIKPHITENELAGLMDLEIRRCGAKPAFDTIVAFGSNASRPHHTPARRRLRRNDTVLIDFGVRLAGYCCDLTRCFAVGALDSRYRKIWCAVKEAQAAAIRAVRAGVEAKVVDAAARSVIRRYGLPDYGHGTGHGLGLEVHEMPGVSAKSGQKLLAGQVITIEPAVYLPGRAGVRIEDDVLVTKTGCKVLTKSCPHNIRHAG